MSDDAAVPPVVIGAAPGTTHYGEIHHLSEIDSTNRYLTDLAAAGAAAGTVAVADHQSAGRGRLGRRWEAPAGANLLVSILLRPTFEIEAYFLCGAVVGLAALAACRGAGIDAELGLKWPNDVVVGERKLAGVLVEVTAPNAGGHRLDGPGPDANGPDENSPKGHNSAVVVVGLGLNVQWPPPDGTVHADEVPDELQQRATSLWRETGAALDPIEVMHAMLGDLDGRLTDLRSAPGRRHQAACFRSASSTLGQMVKVTLMDEDVVGRAIDITDEGHLVVESGSRVRAITAGDVVHLRAEN